MNRNINKYRKETITSICTNFEKQKPRFKTQYVLNQTAELYADFIIEMMGCSTIEQLDKLHDKYCYHYK